MRKRNQEITDKRIIEEVLSQTTICRIAMIDKGEPYLLPFNYGYKDNYIYIHSASRGKKIDVLRAHPRVCFEVEQKTDLMRGTNACDWSTLYRSVIGYGEIDILTDFDKKREGLEIIMAQHGGSEHTKFQDKHLEAVVILKLTIDTLTGKQSSNWERVQEETCLTLETDRLQLQEISWDDLDQLHQLHSIPEVDEFNTLGIPSTVEETKNIMGREIEAQMNVQRSSYTWKIELKAGGQFIGLAGITLSNDKFRLGEIYYKFDPQFWGKGYATEVANKLISTGFEVFELHKVEAGVAVGNKRSIKVLEKVGMKREGLRRKILPIRGDWVDNYHYAIVENDLL